MRKCNICGDEIHPKRLEILPDARQCVSCSTTGKKAGVSVVMGEGDHTYNETIIMDHEDYLKYQELERRLYGKRKDDIIHPDEESVIDEVELDEEIEIEEIKDLKEEDIEDIDLEEDK